MIFHLPALRTPQKTPASLSPAISRLQSRHPSISLGPLPRSLIAWLRIGVLPPLAKWLVVAPQAFLATLAVVHLVLRRTPLLRRVI